MTFGEQCVAAIRDYMSKSCKRWSELTGEHVAPIIDEVLAKQPKRAPSFIPPTAAEVTAYSLEIGYPMNGEAWCDQYSLKGWCTSGSTKMKDWRAAVRRWKAMGWKPSIASEDEVKQETGFTSSEDSLKRELAGVETDLRDLLYPGSCAYKVVPKGADFTRYEALMQKREGLLERLGRYATPRRTQPHRNSVEAEPKQAASLFP